MSLIVNTNSQQNYKEQQLMKDDSALKLLLQKQITSEQYKIIDDYKKTAQNLQKEQSHKKQNSLKLQELQRKISCLQFMNTTSARESMRYQRKLDKLQNTQNYATQLLRLKYKSYVEQEQQHSARKQDCLNKRDALEMNRKLSKSVYDRRKRERIQRIKDDQQKTQLQYRRMSGIIEASNKQKKQKIRQQQLRMKERMKRYQVFKLQRAALNYNQKIQSQFNLLKQRSRYLQDLKSKAKNEQIIFRKSQILNRQTVKIQSIYLTGAEP